MISNTRFPMRLRDAPVRAAVAGFLVISLLAVAAAGVIAGSDAAHSAVGLGTVSVDAIAALQFIFSTRPSNPRNPT